MIRVNCKFFYKSRDGRGRFWMVMITLSSSTFGECQRI